MISRIWSIAWKNIWRNKIRSLVVIISISLGLFGGTMAVGIMTGWIQQRIESAIYNEISHVQIHQPDYMLNEELHYTIPDFNKIKSVLDTLTGVKAWSPRAKTFVMAQSDWAATGLSIKAFDKNMEENVSKIKDCLIEGDYFLKESKTPAIIIGSKAAEDLKLMNFQIDPDKLKNSDTTTFPKVIASKLEKIANTRFRQEKDFKNALSNVLSAQEMNLYGEALIKKFSFYRLGTKLTLTFTDSAGNVLPSAFRVMGIYKTSNTMFDGINAFILYKDWCSETGFNNQKFHEIAIVCDNNDAAFKVSEVLKGEFPGLSILNWKEISPDLGYMVDMMKIIDFIYVGIIMFALAFGIINTMMMAVLERSKEIGMLMAIGMNKNRLFLMIMLESIFLTLTGALIGIIISASLISFLGKTGINFSMWAEGFEAMGYASVVYPALTLNNFINIGFLVIGTGIVSSLWPARKALKLNPVEALRTE
ncbi:MAG: FtsX-like permease family protein [Bacteroidales bacterium]